jgi:hypothetical protein
MEMAKTGLFPTIQLVRNPFEGSGPSAKPGGSNLQLDLFIVRQQKLAGVSEAHGAFPRPFSQILSL